MTDTKTVLDEAVKSYIDICIEISEFALEHGIMSPKLSEKVDKIAEELMLAGVAHYYPERLK